MYPAVTQVQRDNLLTLIEALRSGNYPQADGKLRRAEMPELRGANDPDLILRNAQAAGFCCLGLVCDLAVQGKMEQWSRMGDWLLNERTGEYMFTFGTVMQANYLPLPLAKLIFPLYDSEFHLDEERRDDTTANPRPFSYAFDGESGFSPYRIDRMGDSFTSGAYTLASMNDGPFSFAQIADIIEWCYLSV